MTMWIPERSFLTEKYTLAVSRGGKGNAEVLTFCRCDNEDDALDFCKKKNLEENAADLLSTCESLLHQISTDSDLETVTGARTYAALERQLRMVIANAKGVSIEVPRDYVFTF
jgi:hypothetical protein